jgi:hypothetical protein
VKYPELRLNISQDFLHNIPARDEVVSFIDTVVAGSLYIYVYLYMYINIHIHTNICRLINMYTYIYKYMYKYMYVYTNICIHIY